MPVGQSIKEFFMGQPARTEMISQLRPEQMQLQDLLGRLGTQGLQQYQPSQFNFEPIEQKARQQFATQTIPMLAERFTSLGGGQRSSAFQGALGSAGSELEQGLAGLRSQYGFQQQRAQMSDLLNMLNMALGQSATPLYHPAEQGFLGTAQQSISQAIPLLAKFLPFLL